MTEPLPKTREENLKDIITMLENSIKDYKIALDQPVKFRQFGNHIIHIDDMLVDPNFDTKEVKVNIGPLKAPRFSRTFAKANAPKIVNNNGSRGKAELFPVFAERMIIKLEKLKKAVEDQL